jgi:hypothetical protein
MVKITQSPLLSSKEPFPFLIVSRIKDVIVPNIYVDKTHIPKTPINLG